MRCIDVFMVRFSSGASLGSVRLAMLCRQAAGPTNSGERLVFRPHNNVLLSFPRIAGYSRLVDVSFLTGILAHMHYL